MKDVLWMKIIMEKVFMIKKKKNLFCDSFKNKMGKISTAISQILNDKHILYFNFSLKYLSICLWV